MTNYMNENNTRFIQDENNIQVIFNNIRLNYLLDTNTYAVTTLDNQKINVNQIIFENDKGTVNILELVKQMIDFLTNTLNLKRDFNSFRYAYNDDKTILIITPVYEKKSKKKKELKKEV